MRKSWPQYFMDIAKEVATRSTCDRAYVGCVIVGKGNRILATGYNGSIAGTDHCTEVGHLLVEGSCKRTIHAEMNALYQAARHGISVDGATAYVTHYPCAECMKGLAQAGIESIYYSQHYAHKYENDFDHVFFSIKQEV